MTDTEREEAVIAIVAHLSAANAKMKRIHDGGRVADLLPAARDEIRKAGELAERLGGA